MGILNRDFSLKIINAGFSTTLIVSTSLIQTLILGGDYVPIVITPKDGEVEFYAGNDLVIQSTIIDDSTGSELDVETVIDAMYVLRRCSGEVIFNRQIDNGVFVDPNANQIVVEINRVDTLGLSGRFVHELQIISPTGFSTVYSSEVLLKDSIL